MTTVAIIPARGGSQGVPGKNLRLIGGIPLVARAVRACRAAHRIDDIYVSTDDHAIAKAARSAGAKIILRPADLAGHQSASETALLHGLDQITLTTGVEPQTLVFVQCTSPFIRAEDLDAGVALVNDRLADCAFSAVETFEFLWRDSDTDQPTGTGTVQGQNHDAGYRPLRQNRRPDYRETGAFYVLDVALFRRYQHRFFGRTRVVPVSELASLEIDTAEELALADAFSTVLDRGAADDPTVPQAIDVDAVITDFDGVHTADTAYVDEHGNETVRVSRSDGLGVAMLSRAGIPMLILSRERNPVVTARASKLGIPVLQAVDDKRSAILDWLAEHGIDPTRAAYVGNDINDLGPLKAVGWPIAVPDAHPAVRSAARAVLTRPGGAGAVRELAERVLAARPESAAVVAEITGDAELHWRNSEPFLA